MNSLILSSFQDELTKIAKLNRALRLKRALKNRPDDADLRKAYETALAAHKRRAERLGVDPSKRDAKNFKFIDFMTRSGAGQALGMLAAAPFVAAGKDPSLLIPAGGAGRALATAAYFAPITAQKVRKVSAARRYARTVGAKNVRDPQLLQKAKAYSNRRAAQAQAQRADSKLRQSAEREVENLNPLRKQYQALLQRSRG